MDATRIALEAANRSLAEQSIEPGRVVGVLVEGDMEEGVMAARVSLRTRPTGPRVEVFLGDRMPTFFLTAESMHRAYRAGPSLVVTIGAVGYVLEPLPR